MKKKSIHSIGCMAAEKLTNVSGPAGQLTLVNCSHPITSSTWNSTLETLSNPTAPDPAPLLMRASVADRQSMVAS